MTAREALKELRDNLEIHLKASPMYSTDHCTINSAEVAAMIAEADEVLAKPERNCERFQVAAEALQEWQSLVKAEPNTWDFRYNYWLFAPAEKRKGEDDGSI